MIPISEYPQYPSISHINRWRVSLASDHLLWRDLPWAQQWSHPWHWRPPRMASLAVLEAHLVWHGGPPTIRGRSVGIGMSRNQWKSHENPMKIPWKSMENPWKSMKIPWKIHGNPWKSMENPWKSHVTMWTSNEPSWCWDFHQPNLGAVFQLGLVVGSPQIDHLRGRQQQNSLCPHPSPQTVPPRSFKNGTEAHDIMTQHKQKNIQALWFQSVKCLFYGVFKRTKYVWKCVPQCSAIKIAETQWMSRLLRPQRSSGTSSRGPKAGKCKYWHLVTEALRLLRKKGCLICLETSENLIGEPSVLPCAKACNQKCAQPPKESSCHWCRHHWFHKVEFFWEQGSTGENLPATFWLISTARHCSRLWAICARRCCHTSGFKMFQG